MSEPLLLRVARLCEGLTEVPGQASNPVILKWAKAIGAPSWFDNDSQAWCAVGANRWALACDYPLSGTGFELLRAKSFETWGQPLTTPVLGAVLVFKRPEGAHVGLYVGERPDAYRVLGANQGNSVNETWIAKDRLTAIRWPAGVLVPADASPVIMQADGSAVSNNEA